MHDGFYQQKAPSNKTWPFETEPDNELLFSDCHYSYQFLVQWRKNKVFPIEIHIIDVKFQTMLLLWFGIKSLHFAKFLQ